MDHWEASHTLTDCWPVQGLFLPHSRSCDPHQKAIVVGRLRRCQTHGQRAKIGPPEGPIWPAGWKCETLTVIPNLSTRSRTLCTALNNWMCNMMPDNSTRVWICGTLHNVCVFYKYIFYPFVWFIKFKHSKYISTHTFGVVIQVITLLCLWSGPVQIKSGCIAITNFSVINEI